MSIFIIFGLSKYILEQIQMIVNPELYPCNTFYFYIKFNSDKNYTITDFSEYKNKKLIRQAIFETRPPKDAIEKNIDGVLIRIKPAVVFKVREEYLWKY